jgi:hypothetical protein
LKKKGVRMWTEFIWMRVGSNGELFENSNESSGFKKGSEFLDWLSDFYLLKNDFSPWS